MKNNIIKDKSFAFAVRIVGLYKFLKEEKQEYIMSKQLMRSGTSIGANVCEAIKAVSKKDFTNKIRIALKEASECEYWIELLFATNYLNEAEYKSVMSDCEEVNKILTAISKSIARDFKED